MADTDKPHETVGGLHATYCWCGFNPSPDPTPIKNKDLIAAAKATTDYLYSLDDTCPPEMRVKIGHLRQLINEEFVGKNKSVSSQLIWDILK